MSDRPRRAAVTRSRSTSIVLAAIASLLLSTAALASPANERSQASERGGGVDRVDVIVSIDARAGVSGAEVAAQTTARFGGNVLHTYEHALTGFAASLPAPAIRALQSDGRVRSVERDQVVTIAHHECGHEHPRRGGDDCSISGKVTGIQKTATVTLSGAATADPQHIDTVGNSFAFNELAAGSYTVTAEEGSNSVSEPVDLSSTNVTVNLSLEPVEEEPVDGEPVDEDPAESPVGDEPVEDAGCAFDVDWSSITPPWGIDRIGTGSSSDAATGCGVDVYVIDTGIQSTHPNLAVADEGFASERCRGGGCSADWDDDHGHGTHVAGTIAALGTQTLDDETTVVGVAPNVTLHSVKVLDRRGGGTRSGVMAGIDYVAGQAANSPERPAVANMSLGGRGSKTGDCLAKPNEDDNVFVGTDAYHEAICNASHNGVVFVAAAGNSGADAAGAVPAAYDDTVITVSATDSNDDWAGFSNWGDAKADWTSEKSAPVALAAPGVSILSTWIDSGTRTISGTSMAAPHVAGAAALALETGTGTKGLGNFIDVRRALLDVSKSTGHFTNTSGNPHEEPLVNVESFVLSTSGS